MAPGVADRVLDQSRSFYVAMDEDGVVLRWNPAAAALFGHPAEHAVGRRVADLIVPPSTHAAHEAGIEAFLRTGHGRGIDDHVEVEALRADGSLVPVQLSIWAEETPAGSVFHATGHDLTRQRQQAQVLEVLAASRRGLLLSERPDVARRLLCDTVRKAVACEGVYLYEPDEDDLSVLRLTAESLHLAAPGRPVLAADLALLRRLQDGDSQGMRLTRDRLGTSEGSDVLRDTGLQTFVVRPLLRRDRLVGVLVLGWLAADRDTSSRDPQLLDLLASEAALVFERLTVQEQLRQAARTDPLTGLLNRREHDRELAAAVHRSDADGSPLSLLVLDLDRFKAYNDTHGHPAGDALLVRAASAWTTVLDGEGSLARVGGDEFAVLLEAGAARAREVAGRAAGRDPAGGGADRRARPCTRPAGRPSSSCTEADVDLYAGKRRRRPVAER